MPRLAWMKKLASLLLLVCFVLPLSKCTANRQVPGGGVHTDVSYLYGYQMALDEHADLDTSPANLPILAMLVAVFFVPAMTLLLKQGWRPLVLVCGAFPALYGLYYWVIVYGSDAQIGGILAVECWLFLLIISAAELWFRWRRRR